jgi:hypothetical protein
MACLHFPYRRRHVGNRYAVCGVVVFMVVEQLKRPDFAIRFFD